MNVNALIEAAGWWSYIVVFAVTVGETSAFVGLLLPGETIILLASAIAGRGDLNAVALAAVVVVGGVTGDSLGYALGRRCRQRPSTGPARRIGAGAQIERAQAFLARHGGTAVVTGRFIGFVRAFVPFAAGASGMPYRRFLVSSSAASLVWGVGNVLVGYFVGAAAIELLQSIGLLGAAVLVAVAVFVVVRIRARRRRGNGGTRSLVVASGGTRRGSAQVRVLTCSHKE